jgi:NAD(P)-dependent dehydrogenase (short-subunit alcohol dehydrogenase family)
MGDFASRTVLITGAASGFGRLAARRFAAQGAQVALGDVNEAGLAETVAQVEKAGGKAVAKRCDVSKEEDAKALVDAALAISGRLDVAVNNAGVAHDYIKLPNIPLDLFERMMAINARGVFLGMRFQLPVMERQGGGAIVNIASVAGLVGAPMLSAYAASKFAVVGLTRSAADEYARKNIRINAVCPSFAATPMAEEGLKTLGGSREEAIARMTQRVPMRRLGTAEEVVEAILWLGSDKASFTTGQALAVDGGLSAI